MRMLNGLRTEHQKTRLYEVNPSPVSKTVMTSDEKLHVSEEVFLQRPLESVGNILMRTKADQFDVTPAGGLFKSSVDPNVTVYFPVKAIDEPMTITLQVGNHCFLMVFAIYL